MKQFLLYLLYAGIFFLIQVIGFWVYSTGLMSDSFRGLFYISYVLPFAMITGLIIQGETLGPEADWWIAFFAIAFVVLVYSLVPAAFVWLISYAYKKRRESGLTH